jgi:hypothetical protein
MERLRESELCVAKLVAKLAENGVMKTDLTHENVDIDDPDLFVDALTWLRHEGIAFSTDTHHFYGGTEGKPIASGFRLTSKGFNLLSESYDGDLTLGQAIRRSSESGQGYANAGNLLGGLLGAFTKSVGG